MWNHISISGVWRLEDKFEVWMRFFMRPSAFCASAQSPGKSSIPNLDFNVTSLNGCLPMQRMNLIPDKAAATNVLATPHPYHRMKKQEERDR